MAHRAPHNSSCSRMSLLTAFLTIEASNPSAARNYIATTVAADRCLVIIIASLAKI